MKSVASNFLSTLIVMGASVVTAFDVDWREARDLTTDEREGYVRQLEATLESLAIECVADASISAGYSMRGTPIGRLFFDVRSRSKQIIIRCFLPIREVISGYTNSLSKRRAEEAFGVAANIETEEEREKMRRRRDEFQWQFSREEAEEVAVRWALVLGRVDVTAEDDEWTWSTTWGQEDGIHRVQFQPEFRGVPLLVRSVLVYLSDVEELRLVDYAHHTVPPEEMPVRYPEMIDERRAIALAEAYRKSSHLSEYQEIRDGTFVSARLVWTRPNYIFTDRASPGLQYLANPPRFIWMVTYAYARKYGFPEFSIWLDAVTGEVVGGGG